MIDLTKTYRTRDGREVTNLRRRSDYSGGYPLMADVGSGTYTYTGQGVYYIGEEHSCDLIPVETSAPAQVSGLSSEQSFSFRSEALGHAVRLPYMPGVNRSTVDIVKDAEAFYGFLSGAAAA